MSCRVMLVSGSLRSQSTNAALLRTVRHLAAETFDPVLYTGQGDLPHFSPDDDGDRLDPTVAALRDEIHRADAILFCTPEYAGALPGSFKNLLDWCIGDDRPRSIYEKPAAWINTSPRGAVGAHPELRTVLRYAHATIVERACVDVPINSSMLGPDGLVTDPGARRRLKEAIDVLAAAACGTGPTGEASTPDVP